MPEMEAFGQVDLKACGVKLVVNLDWKKLNSPYACVVELML
jgi:hypothetical protein